MADIEFLSTGRVAELLSVPPHRLEYLLRDRQVRPRKGPTGAFLWTDADVAHAAGLLGVAVPLAPELRRAMSRGVE